ncbi:hypothetical protein [Saccharothrix australiensis]|uniref:Uncharacterized protein n=1 Tax=Saccharothrix australiensis TaxID=2072 RepID=A0A495VR14_9PSEU|nr:hypothetical protein [Saccharothrix australiensis]RKT51826.1 hypothetical protein C8E97_0313 [Saccharothrix australiensis]
MQGYTDEQGRFRPIEGKGKGKGKGGAGVVVAGVAALGVLSAGAGAGTGAVGAGAGAVAEAGVAQAGVGSVRLGGSAGQLRARKSEGQRAARRGEPEGAWQRMGLRQVKRTAKQQAECVAVTFGQVREFVATHRCAYLDRVLFAVADEAGNTAVVSVAWVGLAGSADARRFQDLVDVQGSGDITPLGARVLELDDVTFTGLRYGSDRDGAGVAVAEAENGPGGRFDHESLDAIAEVAAHLPRP